MINVKYFGRSDIPAFDENFGSIDDLMQKEPFKPFGKSNQLGPSGKGFELEKSRHDALKRLEWITSGHIGLNGALAGFDYSGRPAYIPLASLQLGGDVNTELLGISIDNDAKTLFVYSRRAILHSPGAGWVGGEWNMGAGKTLSFGAWTGATTIYLTFNPDNEAEVDISVTQDYPISVRLYTVTVTDGEAALTRVWNSGDVDIIAMWLQGPSV